MERSILEWSARALLMAIGTAAVLGALRVRAAAVLHAAWSAVLVAMLLLPVWTQWGPSVTAQVLPAVQEFAPAPAIPWSAASIDATPAFTQTPLAAPDLPIPILRRVNWQQILLALYLVGIAIMLTRLIAGTLRVRSIMRRTHNIDGFVTSELCGAPVTLGWLRPTLLLPDSWRTWPAAKLEAVLIHEREHIRRRDPLVQWLALLNRCIFWFHPLAWWLERKLAALAEDACDAAVLARGHAAHDYARYLIEIARSVNQTGARIRWAGAVAFSTGKLRQRVRRMMDAPPVTSTSRSKLIASASCCTLLLVACLACNLGRHSSRAPGEPSIAERQQNEMAHSRQTQQQRQQSDQALWKAALSLTPTAAEELESDLKAHPDPDRLLELVRYDESKKNIKALDDLTLWYIEQHPEVRSGWGARPEWDKVWDQDVYARGHQLWTEQMKKSWDSPYVYMNAAEFLSGNDNEEAEQILQEGQRRFPPTGRYSGLHFEVFLARHYAWALIGSPGQLPPGRLVVLARDVSATQPRQDPYAQKVRATLLASKDADLLFSVGEQLQGSRPNLELAIALNEHLLALKPDEPFAHMQRDHLKQFAESFGPRKDPASLTDADRMAQLQSQLAPPVRIRKSEKDVEANARDLLTIASRNTKDPNYGTAVFLADTTLGDLAMDRGDKSEAVRLLLAASEAPPTDYLRYNQLDMSLAGKLVDAGERDAAATFLERCAKFNRAHIPLAEWATQIRKGKNPRLRPDFDMFRKAG